MYNATTMYIDIALLERIDEAAKVLNVSRSRLVSTLLVKYMKSNRAGGRPFGKLVYQSRGAQYEIKSIYLRKDIHELWGDVRKAYKLTASHVIALAIKLYLNELLNCTDLPYNYFQFNLSYTKYYGEVYTNLIIWGSPDKETLIKLIET